VSRIIRSTTRDDRPAILVLVREAFSNGGRDGSEEVDIVKQTWSAEAAAEGLDLVAVEDGEVRGHVLGAHGDLGGRDVVGVVPLAVVPSHHHEGIGTALMTELLGRAERAGLPFVVLLGNPDYYGRFGFEPSGPLGIVYPAVGAGNPDFMVRRLSAYDAQYRGDFTYCWESGPG
jgi:putative acetyltransferase